MKVTTFFAWYDLWIGAYYDRKYKQLYICPLPTIVIQIDLQKYCQLRAEWPVVESSYRTLPSDENAIPWIDIYPPRREYFYCCNCKKNFSIRLKRGQFAYEEEHFMYIESDPYNRQLRVQDILNCPRCFSRSITFCKDKKKEK